MLNTTIGRLLVDDALPPALRAPGRVLDKKGLAALLTEVAATHPDQYREISKRLADIGRRLATESGGNTFGLAHMGKAQAGRRHEQVLRQALQPIIDDDRLTDQERHDAIIHRTGQSQSAQMDEILAESLAEKNPLALQVLSGSRGNKMNLASLRGSDLLYTDHRNRVLPIPVLRSYSQGLSPVEYWAGTYGARQGVLSTKLAVQQSGFLSKQLNNVAHRLMVTDADDPREDMPVRGLPVDTDDRDNEGALLAQELGPYKRNTVLGPKILKHLKAMGHDRILVRSPVVGGSPEGGVYAHDVGVRERGVLPGRGEEVGLTAAQALSEPISQGLLSAKHTGGVAGQAKTNVGFPAINALVQAPETVQGGATHADVDGTVGRIEDAPAGGKYVWVGNTRHYVPPGTAVTVKPHDQVEAGDMLSDGLPHPAAIVRHKGIGEGRRAFTDAMRKTLAASGVSAHRRNIELIARGLINHVELTDEHDGHVPGDVVPYSTLEHTYEPRDGHEVVPPHKALGRYLERPVLHYSIGTRVKPSVVKELKHFGIKDVAVHADPPPFVPAMVRGMAAAAHDQDFLTRLYGGGQKASLLEAAHRGMSSDEHGTSFVPSLARAVDFGRGGLVRQPEPGIKVVEGETVSYVPPLETPKPVLPGESDGGRPSPHRLQSLLPQVKRGWLLDEPGEKTSAESSVEASEPLRLYGPTEGLLSEQPEKNIAAAREMAGEKQGTASNNDASLAGRAPRVHGGRSSEAASAGEKCASGREVHAEGDLGARQGLLPVSAEGESEANAPGARSTASRGWGALPEKYAGGMSAVQLEKRGETAAEGDVVPTDRLTLPTRPPARIIAAGGGAGFKVALDRMAARREAAAVVARVTAALEKTADPPAAPPAGTYQSDPGSSTTNSAGKYTTPGGQSGRVDPPPAAGTDRQPGQGFAFHAPDAPAAIGPPPASAGPPPNPTTSGATPGQVHPDREQLLHPDEPSQPRGLFALHGSDEESADYVHGGSDPADREGGPGGSLGRAARLLAGINLRDTMTLTGGQRFAQGHNPYGPPESSGGGEFGRGHGASGGGASPWDTRLSEMGFTPPEPAEAAGVTPAWMQTPAYQKAMDVNARGTERQLASAVVPRVADRLGGEAAKQLGRTGFNAAVKALPPVLGRAVSAAGGPLATPINAGFEMYDYARGGQPWWSGHDQATTPDGTSLPTTVLRDATGVDLSGAVPGYLGAAYNAWSHPLHSIPDWFSEVGRTGFDAARGAYHLATGENPDGGAQSGIGGVVQQTARSNALDQQGQQLRNWHGNEGLVENRERAEREREAKSNQAMRAQFPRLKTVGWQPPAAAGSATPEQQAIERWRTAGSPMFWFDPVTGQSGLPPGAK